MFFKWIAHKDGLGSLIAKNKAMFFKWIQRLFLCELWKKMRFNKFNPVVEIVSLILVEDCLISE
jgi:hypothetical protein